MYVENGERRFSEYRYRATCINLQALIVGSRRKLPRESVSISHRGALGGRMFLFNRSWSGAPQRNSAVEPAPPIVAYAVCLRTLLVKLATSRTIGVNSKIFLRETGQYTAPRWLDTDWLQNWFAPKRASAIREYMPGRGVPIPLGNPLATCFIQPEQDGSYRHWYAGDGHGDPAMFLAGYCQRG